MSEVRFRSRILRFFRAREGASAVEMAFVILLFVFIFYALFQFSMAIWMWNSLMLAAEEGGRAAMIHNMDYTDNGCDHLWTNFVEPIINYNLPGDASDYTFKYACGGTPTVPTMSIAITYKMTAAGGFGSGMTIPGFTLSGEETVPLD